MSIRKTIPFLFIVVALLPRSALACSGFVDYLFGFSERTEVRATRDIEVERIQAERDRQVARIDAEAVERVRQAEVEVERVRQMQFATEAVRDIAIAEAYARRDEYKAIIAGLTQERVTAIMAESDKQLAALVRLRLLVSLKPATQNAGALPVAGYSPLLRYSLTVC